jgi:glycosidase
MSQFDERMQNLWNATPPKPWLPCSTFSGATTPAGALFMLDHNTYQTDPTLYQDPNYDWSDAVSRLKGAVAVQMTMPGAPPIYYGDEVGLVGPMAYAGGKWEDDPYNRQPFPWLDESGTPFYTHLQTQESQDALYNYYAALTSERNTHPALRTGSYRVLLVDDTQKLYAYGRNLPARIRRWC